MQAILSITVPFFALILAGYAAASRGLLPLTAIPGLNTFVLFFALPCMLLRFGMNTPVLELFDPVIMGLYLACAVLVVALSLGLGRALRIGLKDSAFASLVATFPNSGFIGVPLLVALLGSAAAGPVICTLLVDTFITTSVCLAVAQQGEHQGSGRGAQLKASLIGPLKNPLPWSVALGALMSAMQWTLSGPVDVVVRMLADSASPVALFTIGAVLCRTRRGMGQQQADRLVVGVVGLKLLVHPALVFSAATMAQAAGAALSTLQITAITLAAALPSASNVSLLAERYGADNGRIARIILWSTVLAFIGFSLWAWALTDSKLG